MWLVLDVGNSAAKGGLFRGEALVHTFRIEGIDAVEPSAWSAALRERIGDVRPDRAGLASVVPSATAPLREVLRELTGREALVVSSDLRLPFRLDYQTPHTLGTDRLAAAAAAWTRFGGGSDAGACVVVDAGTAVTYEVVDRAGVYRGGAIAPGPALSARALIGGTAQLPSAVPLELPEHAIGRSTREAIQAGLMWGFLDSVAGMLRRIRGTLKAPTYVVATGGWGPFLQEHLEIDRVEPHLVLEGIRVLMEANPR